jgi:hypothetical protein
MGSVCAAVKPLAIMLCADRVPIDRHVLANSFNSSNAIVVAWSHLVLAVAISPDGNRIVSAGPEGAA